MSDITENIAIGAFIATLIVWIIFAIIIGFCWALPYYSVWAAGKSGEAALKKAEQTKQIRITQAQAEYEASKLQRKAIEEVGEACKKYPQYREQEFISSFGEAIQNNAIQKIYFVPTENNIPLIKGL